MYFKRNKTVLDLEKIKAPAFHEKLGNEENGPSAHINGAMREKKLVLILVKF